MADREQWTTIGRVRSVNVVRRELRVEPAPAHLHEFEVDLAWLRLRGGGAERPMRLRVASVRQGGGAVVVALAPGVPRDRVAEFRGADVVVAAAEAQPRPADVWTPAELSGLRVVARGGVALGSVQEVYEAAGQTTILVARVEGGTLAVPVIDQAVDRVDMAAGCIELGDYGPYAVEEA